MYIPPPSPNACQNCTANITADEQLNSVPRFLCGGQNAIPTASTPHATITGSRYQGSQPRAQIPCSSWAFNFGIQSANICCNLSQNDIMSFDTNTSENTITATAPITPNRNLASPRCQ